MTDVLEQYRLEEIEKQSSNQDRRKMLSPEEIKVAQTYLKAPNLMGRTSEYRKGRSDLPDNKVWLEVDKSCWIELGDFWNMLYSLYYSPQGNSCASLQRMINPNTFRRELRLEVLNTRGFIWIILEKLTKIHC